MSKHNGNLDIYGVLTVGAAISGTQYSFPTVIGANGETMVSVGGDVIFTNIAPYLDVSDISGGSQLVEDVEQIKTFIFGISGNVDTFGELADTPKPSFVIDSHEGEIIIVSPNASLQTQKIDYSGVTISDLATSSDVQSVSGDLYDLIDNISQYTVTTQSITADLTVGSIDAGDYVPAGTTLQQFIEQLITATFYPTFSSPTFTVSRSIASQLEIGSITNVTLTGSFNRGSITGKTVGGIWQPATFQDYRSGAATLYTLNGTPNGTNNTLVVNNYQVVSGNQNWSASVNYGVGPQPVDSKSINYSTPLSSGSLAATTANTTGVRAYFRGTKTNTTIPTTSAEIRGLTTSALNPANGTTFSLSIPIGAQMVLFAYPATLQAVSQVLYVEGLNANVTGIFTQTTISVESANAYDSVNYRVYYYIPAEAFGATATYTVTI
jgi:hypothetical protein